MNQDSTPLVQNERQGACLWLTLNQPQKRNPLGAETVGELRDHLKAAAEDDSVRAVIFRGEGKHFSAGVDLALLQKMSELSYEENLKDSKHLEGLFREVMTHPKLIVAAVHGAAMGGGCGLAAACDLVIASEDAKFQYSEVKIGFVPALVSTFLLRRVPGHIARQMLIDPEMMEAEEAKRLGLVDEVIPREDLFDHAVKRSEAICRKSAPTSLAATKMMLYEVPSMHLDQALGLASEINAKQRATDDCKHGIKTFLDEKTTPDWLG